MTDIAEWAPYTGEYEKKWYNVMLATGEVIRDCWPNAGGFHSFHEVDQHLGRIDGSRVTQIQEVTDPFWKRITEKKGKKHGGRK